MIVMFQRFLKSEVEGFLKQTDMGQLHYWMHF
jgi:hypothetical protein